VKIALSLLLALPLQLFAMPLVNQLSSTSAKAMSVSVSPLLSASPDFATLFLSVRL
jgi:uncharacterized protein YggE